MKRVVLSIVVLFASTVPGILNASSWNIDSENSNIQFKVKRFMFSSVSGSFSDINGTVILAGDDVTKAAVSATIQAGSLKTGSSKMDVHLKSPDFFDVFKYPLVTFNSKQVKKADDGNLKLTGDLTIRGITREIELHVQAPGPEEKDPLGNTRVRISAKAGIKRKDFGLSVNKFLNPGGIMISNKVKISIRLELIKETP